MGVGAKRGFNDVVVHLRGKRSMLLRCKEYVCEECAFKNISGCTVYVCICLSPKSGDIKAFMHIRVLLAKNFHQRYPFYLNCEKMLPSSFSQMQWDGMGWLLTLSLRFIIYYRVW